MKTSDFDYDLPKELIAQTPIERRDSSRLMVLDRKSGEIIEHAIFRDLGGYLQPGDLLVLNQTRVIPARLFGYKIPTGGRVEILLLHRIRHQTWEVLVGGKGVSVGKVIQLDDGPKAQIIDELDGPCRIVQFESPLQNVLEDIGQMPLPPYIHEKLDDPGRYQTVYAEIPGSAAAPTAGLHFTPKLLNQLQNQGVNLAWVTLHVGLDTFAPVTESDPLEHTIHTEWCQVKQETAEAINQTKKNGGRIISVGTTCVRTLETAARGVHSDNFVESVVGPTDLFILPGYEFRVVDAVITNFHLPKSTLIMLVSAFVGRTKILAAYETAKKVGYRFYSFGDAMLIA
jgi:S-adenosylmethionine:tRNA ribosyltransferase-isomerase